MESSVESWWVLPMTLIPAISGEQHENITTLLAIATSFAYLAIFACLAWASASLLYWAHPGGHAWGKYWRAKGQSPRPYPIPGPKGLPVIGSLGLMSGLAHCSLADEAARRPGAKRLMALSLGSVRAVVTSHPDVAKEILDSPAFADRPLNHAAYGLMFHRSIGFAEHGPYWRALRRIAAGHLFGPRQVEAFAPYRAGVAEGIITALRGAGSGVVQVRGLLRRASLYYIMRFVFGKEYDVSRAVVASGEDVEELLEMVHEGYELLGKENWCDYFPRLATLDPQGVGARCAELMPRVNRFVHGIIQEHRAKAIAGGEACDFVDILLSLQESEGLSDADVAAVLWEMIFRGTDAMAVLMEWTLARLVLHRDVQANTHRELDEVVGRNNSVTESAVPSLPYLQALLKEAIRMHPPGPLLSWRHRAISDTYVDGHLVPAGTTAMVNQWAISRDPDVWNTPLEFQPERFLPGGKGQDASVLGADGRLVPFGSGRRSCPGKSLAMTTVTTWMATLLHEFEWLPASDTGAVDLSEVLRLSCEMAVPLEVRVRPRREV
ncbi:cytochrome P450 78A9-like [Phragmites australis]|uniref:cytochrome P450 78A9-like n=1 Tax=Phragmites australis TaxID=29695 RepID=UPI002D7692E7|nr:cytochrome P450 78A9-like [Phragmites australis]